MDRSQYEVKVIREVLLKPSEAKIEPEAAISMMWQLALQAWMFKENLSAEPRLQRHVVALKRMQR